MCAFPVFSGIGCIIDSTAVTSATQWRETRSGAGESLHTLFTCWPQWSKFLNTKHCL